MFQAVVATLHFVVGLVSAVFVSVIVRVRYALLIGLELVRLPAINVLEEARVQTGQAGSRINSIITTTTTKKHCTAAGLAYTEGEKAVQSDPDQIELGLQNVLSRTGIKRPL